MMGLIPLLTTPRRKTPKREQQAADLESLLIKQKEHFAAAEHISAKGLKTWNKFHKSLAEIGLCEVYLIKV